MLLAAIALDRLRNEEHYQFITSFDRLLAKEDLGALKVDELYPGFKDACTLEKQAIERIWALDVTHQIKEKDVVRGGIYRSIVLQVNRNLTPGMDLAQQQAARLVKVYLKKYGNLSRRMVTEKDATYSNFVKDLQEKCPTQVTALGLTSDLLALEQLSTAIEGLMDRRTAQRGVLRDQGSMVEIRRLVNSLFKELRVVLNGSIRLNQTGDYAEFLSGYNSLVADHKQGIALRAGLRKALAEKKLAKQGQEPQQEPEPALLATSEWTGTGGPSVTYVNKV